MALLWSTLLLYVLGRLCQLYANRLPTLLIVILHVVPPATFAIVHGSILYRLKGISILPPSVLVSVVSRKAPAFGQAFRLGTITSPMQWDRRSFMCPFCSSSLTSVSVTSPGYWLFSSSTDVCGAVEAKFLVHGDCALCYLRPQSLDHVWIWQHGAFLTAYVYYLAFALYSGGPG
jgi:hypothetical protein